MELLLSHEGHTRLVVKVQPLCRRSTVSWFNVLWPPRTPTDFGTRTNLAFSRCTTAFIEASCWRMWVRCLVKELLPPWLARL